MTMPSQNQYNIHIGNFMMKYMIKENFTALRATALPSQHIIDFTKNSFQATARITVRNNYIGATSVGGDFCSFV